MLQLLMTKKAILGISFAAVFAVSMIFSPLAFAHFAGTASPDRTILSVDEFEMKTVGSNPGGTTDGHDILVYAFFTDTPGKSANSFVAYVVAFHPTFADDGEQHPDITVGHAHKLELNNDSLCVQDLKVAPKADIDDNELEIENAKGNVIVWVIAGYDVTVAGGILGGSGICPTFVYDAA